MSTPAKAKEVYIRVGHRYSKSIGAYGVLGGRSFDCPVDVAWDSNERLYVLNRPEGNVRITVLDFDEQYYHEFVRPGTQDGQLIWPSCIAVDPDDVLYVSDQHTHRISLFNTEGTFLGKWGTEGSGDGEFKGTQWTGPSIPTGTCTLWTRATTGCRSSPEMAACF